MALYRIGKGVTPPPSYNTLVYWASPWGLILNKSTVTRLANLVQNLPLKNATSCFVHNKTFWFRTEPTFTRFIEKARIGLSLFLAGSGIIWQTFLKLVGQRKRRHTMPCNHPHVVPLYHKWMAVAAASSSKKPRFWAIDGQLQSRLHNREQNQTTPYKLYYTILLYHPILYL